MMNFFLLNEAIDVSDYDIFIEGIKLIIGINKKAKYQYLKHSSVWNLPHISNLFYSRTQDNQVIITYISQLSDSISYLSDESLFDSEHPDRCNGFLGIDFSTININSNRQITDERSCSNFESQCIQNFKFNSIDEFWDLKEDIFSDLVFCESIFEQISHFSVNDNRFKQIFEKLRILNNFTIGWSSGIFNHQKLGMENSPDTPNRIKSTLSLRTFDCPNIGAQVFSWHVKWYIGNQPFRLYYHASTIDHKVYVGYIGNKSDIGF
ncbi:hypothetical protein ACWA1C_20175 [Flectobacillus roseus]